MNQRHLALLALASASVCAVVFTACGGDDSNNGDSGGNDATTNDVVTNDSPQSNDTGGNDTGGNDGGSDVVTTDSGCAPGPGCQMCCGQKYPDAAASVRANEESCACTTPGDCNTPQTCKSTLCAGQAPNPACVTCLTDKDAGDCRAKAATACFQDPSCQPYALCIGQCAAVINDAGGGG